MFVPLLLIVPAILAAGVVAYGTAPQWAQYSRGLELIMLTRRLQWPLVTLVILLSLALLVLIISGRRRAWWLIALGPIVALLAHRFTTGPSAHFTVLDSPNFVAADHANAIVNDDDSVVGLLFGDTAYAYPFATLYTSPAVIQSDQNKRMILMWSPFANRAMAWTIDRNLKARDLEVVSMPANALLLYNARLGQFINGVTAQTKSGEKPSGFGQRIATSKMMWKDWRREHPATLVLDSPRTTKVAAPRGAVLPMYPLPKKLDLAGHAADERIIVVGNETPLVIPSQRITSAPMNVSANGALLLISRDPSTGALHAYDRRIWEDLMPRFAPNGDPKRAGVAFIDADTATGWSDAGAAVDGPDKTHHGFKLSPVIAEQGLYWGVMKAWYPNLTYVDAWPTTQPIEQPKPEEKPRVKPRRSARGS